MLKLNALWSRLNKLRHVVFGAPPKSYTMSVTDDMTGRAMSSDGKFVKITNDAPNPMIGWMVSGKSPEGDSFSFVVGQDGEGSDTIDDSGMFWDIGGGYVVYVAGATVEETIFPEVGVYLPAPSAMEEEGITSVTVTEPTTDLNGAPFVMQDGKPVWGAPIDPKFLPSNIGGSGVYELDVVALGFDMTSTENQILSVSQEVVDEICNAVKSNKLVILAVKMDTVSMKQIPYTQVDMGDTGATIIYSSFDVTAMSIDLLEVQIDKQNCKIGIGQTVIPLGGSATT